MMADRFGSTKNNDATSIVRWAERLYISGSGIAEFCNEKFFENVIFLF